MPGFFRVHKENILILIRSTPTRYNRSYATFASFPAHKRKTNQESLRNKFLRKYGLSSLNLRWPEATASSSKGVDYIKKTPKSIRQMYGESDLSKLAIFQGGFINFGYWPNPFFESDKITLEQRIECSREMYKVVGDLAGVLRQHSVLDVGCGLGYGSEFFSQYYQPRLVVGLDISPDQVARAKKYHVAGIKSGKLRFTIGEAESLPFPDGTFDRIVSVEAAHHFVSISSFSEEVSRILKPGGKLVVTSFFPTNSEGLDALNAIVPDYHIHGSQHTIGEVQNEFAEHMNYVKVSSIGQNVWYGFSRWLDQIGFQNQWSKIWCALYEKGLIDYVVYEATAPKGNLLPKAETEGSLNSHRMR